MAKKGERATATEKMAFREHYKAVFKTIEDGAGDCALLASGMTVEEAAAMPNPLMAMSELGLMHCNVNVIVGAIIDLLDHPDYFNNFAKEMAVVSHKLESMKKTKASWLN